MVLNFDKLDYCFIHKPLLVGGKAMEIPKYHDDMEMIVKLVLDKAYGKA